MAARLLGGALLISLALGHNHQDHHNHHHARHQRRDAEEDMPKFHRMEHQPVRERGEHMLWGQSKEDQGLMFKGLPPVPPPITDDFLRKRHELIKVATKACAADFQAACGSVQPNIRNGRPHRDSAPGHVFHAAVHGLGFGSREQDQCMLNKMSELKEECRVAITALNDWNDTHIKEAVGGLAEEGKRVMPLLPRPFPVPLLTLPLPLLDPAGEKQAPFVGEVHEGPQWIDFDMPPPPVDAPMGMPGVPRGPRPHMMGPGANTGMMNPESLDGNDAEGAIGFDTMDGPPGLPPGVCILFGVFWIALAVVIIKGAVAQEKRRKALLTIWRTIHGNPELKTSVEQAAGVEVPEPPKDRCWRKVLRVVVLGFLVAVMISLAVQLSGPPPPPPSGPQPQPQPDTNDSDADSTDDGNMPRPFPIVPFVVAFVLVFTVISIAIKGCKALCRTARRSSSASSYPGTAARHVQGYEQVPLSEPTGDYVAFNSPTRPQVYVGVPVSAPPANAVAHTFGPATVV